VAVNLFPTNFLDPAAPAEPQHDCEAEAYGDDWRTIVRQVAETMAVRTGLPVSEPASIPTLPRGRARAAAGLTRRHLSAIIPRIHLS
jgi:hypothetical protein